MKTLLCLFGCMGGILPAAAQSLQYPHGALFAGNGAYSVRFADLFSFLCNAASLAVCSRVSAGVYAENKFGLRELKNYTAAAQMPVTGGAVGLIATWSGSALFNQSQMGVAYGKRLGNINVGLRFNYTMLRIAGYGSKGTISYEIGSTWKITEKFCTGVQILPSVYSVGAGYECSEQLHISTTITKEESKPVNVQAAVQYNIAGGLLTMLGINSSTASPSFCIGWLKKQLRILMSGSFHFQLGLSTGIGIVFYGRNKDE
jgi:hypothetical protein